MFTGVVIDVEPSNRSLLDLIISNGQELALFQMSNLRSIFLACELTLDNSIADVELLISYSKKLTNPVQMVFLKLQDFRSSAMLSAVKQVIEVGQVKTVFLSVIDDNWNWAEWCRFYEMLKFDIKVKLHVDLATVQAAHDSTELDRFLGENIGAVSITAVTRNGMIKKRMFSQDFENLRNFMIFILLSQQPSSSSSK